MLKSGLSGMLSAFGPASILVSILALAGCADMPAGGPPAPAEPLAPPPVAAPKLSGPMRFSTAALRSRTANTEVSDASSAA